jgi:hypothetical protein
MDYVCGSIRDYVSECDRNGLWITSSKSGKMGDVLYDFRVSIDQNCHIPYDLEKILNYMVLVTELIQRLQHSASISMLTIDLRLTPFRKTWCPQTPNLLSDEKPVHKIGVCEVNSGDTTFRANKKRDIRIWRAEDWSKVLLHELLHAFDWDDLIPKNTINNESEALVEAMATWLHCQILGGRHWKQLLDEQRQWMRQHLCALQKFAWRPLNTSVHSYYILKFALLWDDTALNAFAQWLQQTEKQCRQTWPQLVHWALDRIKTPFYQCQGWTPPPPPNSCISMRMIYHQLALNPSIYI